MFVVEGVRIRGDSYRRVYSDYKIAKFEYEAIALVSNYTVLSDQCNGLYKELYLYIKQ